MNILFKTIGRNIGKNKTFAIINVIGLSLGICACLVIYFITSYDFNFDNFHPDRDRIFRIIGEARNDKGEKMLLNSPFRDVAGLQYTIPGFQAKTGFRLYGQDVTIPAQGGQPRKKFSGKLTGSPSTASILTGPDFLTFSDTSGSLVPPPYSMFLST